LRGNIWFGGASFLQHRFCRMARRGLALSGQSAVYAGRVTPVSQTAADLVLTGGRFYTVDPALLWAEAVAIRDGRLAYVGDAAGADALVGPTTRRHDLGGRVVLPGLIDSHTHPGLVSGSKDVFILPDTLDPAELLDAVAEAARLHPERELLVGGYWPIAAFDMTGPNRHHLDPVVPNRPVILYDDSGHSQWLNSAALALLGITRDTPDPVPGFSCFARDAAGDPTGWAKEFALQPYLRRLGVGGGAQPDELAAFLRYLVAHGVVAVLDGGNQDAEDAVYMTLAALDRAGQLPLRYEGAAHVTLPEQVAGVVERVELLQRLYGGRRLRINTVKLVLDGVTEVGTAAVLDPYLDGPDSRGNTVISGEELERLILALHERRIELHMHSVGDRAVRTALDAVERARAVVGGPLATRVSLSHLEVLDPADLARFAGLDVVANFTPHWYGGYFEGAERWLGAERYEHMYQVMTLRRAGAEVAYSSDITDNIEWRTDRANPFLGMQAAHTRLEIGAAEGAPPRPPASECVPLEELVRGYTAGSAFQLRLERDLGSLEVGKSADLVILDRDLFAVEPSAIHKVAPVAVIIEGVVVHGELT
jgi:predicted amidohydrolase YtcJ